MGGTGSGSYISEVAEERVGLGTIGLDITPEAEVYVDTVEHLMALQAHRLPSGLGGVAWAFRRRHYRLAQRWLRERRQIVPCYFGWASAQISPDGEVWFCCIRAEPVGNLRETGHDFEKLWWSKRARALREDVRAGCCDCPLANAAYTNLLLHPPSLVGVAWDLARGNGRR